MDYLEIKDVVTKEYNSDIATLVVVAITVLLCTPILEADVKDPRSFTSRVHEKVLSILWECDVSDVELAIKIQKAWHHYSANLMVGAPSGTLKDIVEEFFGS